MEPGLPITEVTVHPDGARVTRRGRLRVEGGLLRVRGLPLLLDESSLRAAVVGASLRAMRLDLDLEGLDRGDEPALHRAWREAEHALERLQAQRALLLRQREGLLALSPPTPDDLDEAPARAPGLSRVRAWARLGEAVEARLQALDVGVEALAPAIDAATERRDLALHALQRSSTEPAWAHWAPSRVLELEVDGEGEVELALSYCVEGARWAPAYTLRAEPDLRAGRLLLRAVVIQATGEDWRGVALSLSSAPGARRVALPELPSLRLGLAQAPPRPAWRALPPGLDALFPAAPLDEPGAPPPPALPVPSPRPVEPARPRKKARRREPVAAQAEVEEHRVFSESEDEAGSFYGELSADEPLESARQAFGGAPPGAPPPAPAPAPSRMAPPPAPASAMMAPPPAPMAAAPLGAARSRAGAPPMAKRMSAEGAGGVARAEAPAPPPPPPELAPEADLLDYPRLRLAPPGAPTGRRGRLHPVDLVEAAVEQAGLTPEQAAGLRGCVDVARRRARGAATRALPPQHVVPGPVEGAYARHAATGPVDVPSNGEFVQLTLSAHPARLTLRHRAVPREDPRVFRRLEVELDLGGPLLPGPIDITVGGALVRSFPLPGGLRGARVHLGMGVDDGLRLARNLRHHEESAGMFRGSRRLITEIEVEVASSLGQEVEVELLERLPVAAEDGIDVRPLLAEPEALPWRGDPGRPELKGGRVQRLRVPAGGLARARFHYAVTLDNKHELEGGDRRG